MSDHDVVIVGSGINSLVCAAELTAKGRHVVVLERAAVAGGCIRTAEATLPGFRHDLFSMTYPLFVSSAAYPVLAPLLEEQGVRFVRPPLPTGVLLPDGRWTALHPDRGRTIVALNTAAPGDGAAFTEAMTEIRDHAKLVFGLLGEEPRGVTTLALLARATMTEGLDELAAFGGSALRPLRAWLEDSFSSPLSRALIAPWVLHAGLGPDAAASALMGKVILSSLDAAGMPFVEGGSDKLVEAFVRIIATGGGAVVTNTEVSGIEVARGRARAVSTRDGARFGAKRAVVCNVTPQQLYGQLLPAALVPSATAARAQAYRYGHACLQIHLALSSPPAWPVAELGTIGLLHLTPGLDGVSRAVNEADRGLLPAEATIVVGQPAAADPTRCPAGASILWLQLQELPRLVRGDAAGTLPIPEDGRWTDALADAYADRIIARLRAHIPGLDETIIGRAVLGPHRLEEQNMNLVGGDPYSGVCSIDQFHLFRPFGGAHNHRTPIDRLFHIGASTHPGPGLGGMSGHLVAQEIG